MLCSNLARWWMPDNAAEFKIWCMLQRHKVWNKPLSPRLPTDRHGACQELAPNLTQEWSRKVCNNTKGFSHTVGRSVTWDPARPQIKDDSLVQCQQAPLRQLRFSRKKNLTILENKNLGGNPPKECDWRWEPIFFRLWKEIPMCFTFLRAEKKKL